MSSKKKKLEEENNLELDELINQAYDPDNDSDKDELSFDEVFRLMLTLCAKEKFRVDKETNPRIIRKLNSSTVAKESRYLFIIANKVFLRKSESEKTVFVFDFANERKETKPRTYSFLQYNIQSSGGFKFKLNERKAIEDALQIDVAKDRDEFCRAFAQIANTTRPDICATVDMLAKYPFLVNKEYQRKFCLYMRQTIDHCLAINPHHSYNTQYDIVGYTDASIDPDKSGDMAQLGYVVFLFGAPIAWTSSKWDKFLEEIKEIGLRKEQIDYLEREAQELIRDKIYKITKLLHFLEEKFQQFHVSQKRFLIRSDNLNEYKKMKSALKKIPLARLQDIERKIDDQKYVRLFKERKVVEYLHISGEINPADNLTRELDFKTVQRKRQKKIFEENVEENNSAFSDQFVTNNSDFMHFLKLFPSAGNQLGEPFRGVAMNNNMDIDGEVNDDL